MFDRVIKQQITTQNLPVPLWTFHSIYIHVSDHYQWKLTNTPLLGIKNSNNGADGRVWRWGDRMSASKARRQLRKSAGRPTEKDNNWFPPLRSPSKAWNSGAEHLIREEWVVPPKLGQSCWGPVYLARWQEDRYQIMVSLFFQFTSLNIFYLLIYSISAGCFHPRATVNLSNVKGKCPTESIQQSLCCGIKFHLLVFCALQCRVELETKNPPSVHLTWQKLSPLLLKFARHVLNTQLCDTYCYWRA